MLDQTPCTYKLIYFNIQKLYSLKVCILLKQMTFDYFFSLFYLTLKAPITTAADDKYGDNFPNF